MKTGKRFLVFGIGVLLGIILIFVLFVNKDLLGFLPSNRVKRDIQSYSIVITDFQRELLACNAIEEEFIFKMIEEADVNFSNSITHYTQAGYIVNGKKNNLKVKKYELELDDTKLQFWLCPDENLAVVNNIDRSPCFTEKLDDDTLHLLSMPNELLLKKLRAKKLFLPKTFKCLMGCNGMNEDDIKSVLKDGEILIDQSFPYRKPNPLLFIRKELNGVDYVFWVEEGATKTRVKYVVDITGIKIDPETMLIGSLFDQVKAQDVCGCY